MPTQETELLAQDKLLWLGLSEAASSLSEVDEETDRLDELLENFETFETDIQDFTSLSEFNTYLQDIGFTEDEADNFVEKINNNFTDEDGDGSVWDEFNNYVQNEISSFSELSTGFGEVTEFTGTSETESGVAASGIKFHESGGVTRAGVSVPPGSTEVYGREIHFSQSSPPAGEDTGSSGGVSYSNIRADTYAPLIGDIVEISADITNNYSTSTSLSVDFKEDGVSIADNSITIGSGNTETITFSVSKSSYESHEYSIGGSDSVLVQWVPELTGGYP